MASIVAASVEEPLRWPVRKAPLVALPTQPHLFGLIRINWYHEDHHHPARPVHALDSVELDVAGGRRTADEGHGSAGVPAGDRPRGPPPHPAGPPDAPLAGPPAARPPPAPARPPPAAQASRFRHLP